MMPLYAGLFGLAFGSFASAAAGRIQRGESLLGRSRCDACGGVLGARHLAPVVSYIVLRGRCAACRARISASVPLTEAAFAIVFAVLALVMIPGYAIAACGFFTAAFIAAGCASGHTAAKADAE